MSRRLYRPTSFEVRYSGCTSERQGKRWVCLLLSAPIIVFTCCVSIDSFSFFLVLGTLFKYYFFGEMGTRKWLQSARFRCQFYSSFRNPLLLFPCKNNIELLLLAINLFQNVFFLLSKIYFFTNVVDVEGE